MSQYHDPSLIEEIKNILAYEMDDDSDQQIMKFLEQLQQKMKGESSNVRQQKRRYFDREREVGHVRLFNDYFSDEPVYPSNIFR